MKWGIRFVSLGARPGQPGEVTLLRALGHGQDRYPDRLRGRVAVHADDDPLARIELALEAVRRGRDLARRVARGDRLDHAAPPGRLVEVAPDLALDLVRERLDEPRPAERVDRRRDARFLEHDLLLAQ